MALNIGKQFIKGQRVAVHAAALESINATDYQPTGYLFSQASIEEVDAANRDVIEHNVTLMGLEMARKDEIRRKRLEKLGLGD